LKIAGKIRYKTNDAHRKIRDARIEKIREENRQLVLDYLREHPCIDCGEADPIVLQFDHRNPKDKKKAVANLVRYYSTEVVGTEIAKCDVRCANCHIRRTGKQFGWWKNDKKYGTS
jgi:L-lysine 2,3-aminomutase